MHLKSFVATTLLAAGLLAVPALTHAADKAEKADAAPSAADTALINKARANYPMKTCLTSDEPLGSMGEAYGYVHRAAGQPDRVVFFCCDGCVDDFKKEPAKYLAKLDAAAKAKGGKTGGKKDGKDASAKKHDH